MTPAFAELVDGYEAHLFVRGRSPGTVKGYLWALEDLVLFLERAGRRHPREVHYDDLEAWQATLARRVKPGSQRLAATAARGFLRWAGRRPSGFAPDLSEYVIEVSVPRPLPRPIEHADLARIVTHYRPRRTRTSIVHLRNRALFFYLLETGARVSEVLQVTKAEARRAIVWQKGRTERVLEVGPRVIAMVLDYLEARDDDCPWLWVTHEAGDEYGPRPLSPDAVRELWKPLCAKLGIPRFTTHQIRHTTATELLDADVDHLVAAAHLGHSGLRTIQTYAKVRDRKREQARDVLERLIA